MKRWVLIAFMGAMLAAGAAQTAAPTPAPQTPAPQTPVPRAAAQDPEARYQALLAKAKAGDAPVDWAALRFAYADRPGPPTAPKDARAQMTAAIQRKDYDQALARAAALIEANYADPEAHLAASVAYRGLGRADDAARERGMAQGIFKSMMTGDGLTPSSAYTAVSVAEEYQLMSALGRRVTSQFLTYAGGHGYDMLTTVGETGDVTAYYFQIDRVLEAERKRLEGAK